jgi:hypothetical protein
MSEPYNIANKKDWEVEEWHCVNRFLDDLNVPKENVDGLTYSTVGRIVELMKMVEHDRYPERFLSKKDWVESTIYKIVTGQL